MPVNLIIRNPLDWDALAIARNANGANRRELSDYVRSLKSLGVWSDLGFMRDFANGKSLNHGFGPNIAFTRGSNATYFNAAGTLTTATTNEPRFDHNPSTGASLGLLIEEARTNSIRNSQAGGATNGVIGSGGVMPTNWIIGAGLTSNGISTEVIGTATSSGLSYIDIKVSGTPTSSTAGTIRPEIPAQTVAANGQAWTMSAYVSLVGGATTNATVRIGAIGNNGSADVAPATETTFTPTSAALLTQRRSTTITLNDASITRVGGYIQVAYTSGQAIDLTLRIAAPQLEQGAFPTSYIPTTTAAATRAADSAVVTPISSFYNQSEGTLFAEAIASTTNGVASVGASQHVASLVENTTGNLAISLFRTNSATTGAFFVGTSGGTQANMNQAGFTANTNTRLIGAYKQDDFAMSVNGASASTDTLGSLPSPTGLRLGIYGSVSGSLNGHIRKVAYWPKRLTNTLLQQLTT